MFVFNKIEANEIQSHHFEITGSTYAPEGEVYLNGKIIKCSDYEGLIEIANICALCNDSSVDFNDVSNHLEAYSGWKLHRHTHSKLGPFLPL
jgi:Ca2+ transporting ATPase